MEYLFISDLTLIFEFVQNAAMQTNPHVHLLRQNNCHYVAIALWQKAKPAQLNDIMRNRKTLT